MATKKPSTRKTGRPTKLTPEIQEIIVSTIRVGAYQVTAQMRAGIGATTFHEWMLKGEEGEEPYADFAKAVKLAEADSEAQRIARIARAGTGIQADIDPDDPDAPREWIIRPQWQADAWYLERRYPERYGKRLELGSDPKKPLKVTIDHFGPDDEGGGGKPDGS